LLPAKSFSTIIRHEKLHLPAISLTHNYRQAERARGQPCCHRREPVTEATTDHSQQVPPAGAESNHPGSHRSRITIPIPESTTLSQVSNHHQAIHPARYSQSVEETQVSPLYSPRGGRKPGPKGPSKEVIKAIVEMKQRNTRGLQTNWKTSSRISGTITTSIGVTPVETVPLRFLLTTERSLRSIVIAGKSIVAGYFNCRWRLRMGIRQGHLGPLAKIRRVGGLHHEYTRLPAQDGFN